jgi:hypothetical protein
MYYRCFWRRSFRGLRRRTSLEDRQENTNDEKWPKHWHDPNNESAGRTVTGVIREVRLDAAHASVVHKEQAARTKHTRGYGDFKVYCQKPKARRRRDTCC